jgi:multiple sugar transport system permease protein
MTASSTSREPTAAAVASTSRPRKRIDWRRKGAWALLGLLMFITLFPFLWVLRTSVSTNASLAGSATSLIPTELSLGAYRRVLGLATTEEAQAEGGSGASVNFTHALVNSLIVSTMVTVGQVLFSTMAAYAFARLRFPGRDRIFFVFLAALMIPPIFVTLPNFVLVKDLGLLNTYLGVALPVLFMTPFAVFFMRQFFLGINHEIEEAGFLDGASRFSLFRRIIVPISAAPIATLALLTFIGSWNDYLWPRLVAPREDVRLLTVALGVFRAQTPQGAPDWSGLMAATVIGALPIVILLLIAGRKVVNSIGFSGIT